MRRRGLECPRLVIGDGHLGIWGALRNVYPQAAEQRCWNHKILNVLAKLPKRQQDQAKLMLRTIPYAPTRTEAERLRTVFTRWCGDHSYEAASEALERDWDRMVTFYDFPKERPVDRRRRCSPGGADTGLRRSAPSHDEPGEKALEDRRREDYYAVCPHHQRHEGYDVEVEPPHGPDARIDLRKVPPAARNEVTSIGV